jgi:hypothetical protein
MKTAPAGLDEVDVLLDLLDVSCRERQRDTETDRDRQRERETETENLM